MRDNRQGRSAFRRIQPIPYETRTNSTSDEQDLLSILIVECECLTVIRGAWDRNPGMPQTKRKATQQPIREEVIERAIRTTHEEFQCALVVEWDASIDGATILNAMAVQPYQRRKCGKPIAGMREICACKTKID